MDSKVFADLQKVLASNGIEYRDNKFQKGSEVLSVTVIGMILKASTKYARHADSAIAELLTAYQAHKPDQIDDVDDDKEFEGGYLYKLSGITQLPLDIDKRLMSSVKFAKDSNNTVVYYLKSVVDGIATYTPILTHNGKLDLSNFVKMDNYQKAFEKFEELLVGYERGIIETFANSEDKIAFRLGEINNYIKKNIPMAIQKNCKITWNVNKYTTSHVVRDVIIANDRNSHPTYADYVAMYIEDFGNLYLDQIPMPPAYSNNGGSINNLDISKYIDGERVDMSPYWVEFFSKFTADEQKVFLAWIWGVLDNRNKSRQALCLYDRNGYSAKSAFAHVMSSILGSNLVASINKDSLSNQFGFAKLWDKRLVIAADSKNQQIIRTEKMHLLLGGDMVDIEYKSRDTFSAKLSSKVLINTNMPLEIDPKLLHERTRIIILKVNMRDEVLRSLALKDANGNAIKDQHGQYKLVGDPNFEKNLIATADTMLINAYYAYCELCPTHGDYALPDSVLESLYECEPVTTTSHESLMSHIISVTNDEHDVMLQSDLYEIYITYCTNNSQYKSFSSNQEFGNFKNFLLKNHNVETKQLTVNGKKSRYLVGIKRIRNNENIKEENYDELSQFRPTLRKGFE